MAAFTANQVTVSNGQKNIVINSNEAPEGVSKGDFIGVSSFALMEINRTYVDSNNKHVIELVKNWDNSNQSNQPAIVIPTTANFKQTADALIKANILINDNTQAMQDWQTKSGTVTFNNIDGTTTTVKTLKQIEVEAQDQMDATHPYPWATRKVEFEANRAQNNELYAASGFVHFGRHSSGALPINEGATARPFEGSENCILLGRESVTDNGGISKKNFPTINIAGAGSRLTMGGQDGFNGAYSCKVKLPPAEDGTRTYDSATGVSVTHATPDIAFASETETNKVVTDRVDMWGFEAYLREINDADPFVYANGLIQSLATSINDVPTVTDNVRPDTYFAWYEGDDSSTGRGVNWQTASESDRAKIASDPDNNIYFDDETGKFYQWCVRGRSFAGVGNGDWAAIDSSFTGFFGQLKFSPNANKGMIQTQGSENIPATNIHNSYYIPNNSSGYGDTANSFTGTYSNRYPKDPTGYNYFLVCGTVNRLNQGAYHPSFNPSGAGRLVRLASTAAGGNYWHDKGLIPAFSEVSDLFTKEAHGGVLSNKDFGASYNEASGRPDGRYYDVIYASGQGGVCRDMRYSAWGLNQEDFAEADLKVKSGEYRGSEPLSVVSFKKSEIVDVGLGATFGVGTTYIYVGDRSDNEAASLEVLVKKGGTLVLGDVAFKVLPDRSPYGSQYIRVNKLIYLSDGSPFSTKAYFGSVCGYSPVQTGTYDYYSAPVLLTCESPAKFSIAGAYTHTEVIGDPANILQCDDLKDGWVGSWNPESPNGSTKDYKLRRKITDTSSLSINYSEDTGSSWIHTKTATGFDAPSNTIGHPTVMGDGNLCVVHYTTNAKMTRDSENEKVHSGSKGVGDVFYTSYFQGNFGALLGFDLINRALTQEGGSTRIGSAELSNILLEVTGGVAGSGSGSIYMDNHHAAITLAPPANDGVAFKTLNYNTVENQQGFINYAYTELTYDETAGDWGDDGKIHIADNQTTMLDENGHTVLVGTARTVEPLGWIKNDK